MKLQHLEEQVASAEERALHLSLIGHGQFERGELAEVRNKLTVLEKQLSPHLCSQGRRLRTKLASIRAELEVVEYSLGKESLPPVAA